MTNRRRYDVRSLRLAGSRVAQPPAADVEMQMVVMGGIVAGKDGDQGVNVASMEESAQEHAVASHLSGMPHVDAEALTGADRMTIHVFGNEERQQAVVCAVLDNLGKGAAGQAVQNLELMLGLSHDA